MADHWNADGERMDSDEQVRGRATGEDEFDEVTEDQEDQDEEDIDDQDDSTF